MEALFPPSPPPLLPASSASCRELDAVLHPSVFRDGHRSPPLRFDPLPDVTALFSPLLHLGAARRSAALLRQTIAGKNHLRAVPSLAARAACRSFFVLFRRSRLVFADARLSPRLHYFFLRSKVHVPARGSRIVGWGAFSFRSGPRRFFFPFQRKRLPSRAISIPLNSRALLPIWSDHLRGFFFHSSQTCLPLPLPLRILF